jgi:hypothetical protein
MISSSRSAKKNQKTINLAITMSEALKSATYIFYHTIFKDKGKKPNSLTIDQLKELVPEKFNFDIVNQVFENATTSLDFKFDGRFGKIFTYFKVDNITYKGTLEYVRATFPDKKNWESLNIRLPNDRFCYSKETDLKLFKTGEQRHRTQGWSILSRDEDKRFGKLINFCKEKLGAKFSCTIFYNFVENRIDFIARDSTNLRQIQICFEPGFPNDDLPEDDVWHQVE